MPTEQLIVVAPFSYAINHPLRLQRAMNARKGKRPKKTHKQGKLCRRHNIFDRFDDEVFVQGSSCFDYSTTTPRGMQSFHVAIVPIETYRQSAASVRALVGV